MGMVSPEALSNIVQFVNTTLDCAATKVTHPIRQDTDVGGELEVAYLPSARCSACYCVCLGEQVLVSAPSRMFVKRESDAVA